MIGLSPEEFASELASFWRPDDDEHYHVATDALLSRDDEFVRLTLRAMEGRLRGQYYEREHARECSYFFKWVAVRLAGAAPPLRRSVYLTACEMQLKYGQSYNARYWTLDTIGHLPLQDADVAVDLLARIAETYYFEEAIAQCAFLKIDPVVNFLHNALSDLRIGVRRAIVQSLGALADPGSFNVILPLLCHPDEPVQLAAVEALFSIDPGRACREPQVVYVDSPCSVRLRLVRLLGETAELQGIEALRTCLNGSTDPEARVFAARSIGMIGPHIAPCELIRALADPEASVRGMAAWALGEISDDSAEIPLELLRSDADEFTRWSAANALSKIASSRPPAVRPCSEPKYDPRMASPTRVVPFRIVVASPNDVPEERIAISQIADQLNYGLAAELGLRLEVRQWETDSLDTCDLLVGVFWKHFDTPVFDAKSGTEHVFRIASTNDRPQMLVYFNVRPYTPVSRHETEQWQRVMLFRRDLRKERFWWSYNGVRHFECLLRRHLRMLLRRQVAKTKVCNQALFRPLEKPDSGDSLKCMSAMSLIVGQVFDDVLRAGIESGARGGRELYALYAAINRLVDCSERFTGLLDQPNGHADVESLVKRHQNLADGFQEFAEAYDACREPLGIGRALPRTRRELMFRTKGPGYGHDVLEASTDELRKTQQLLVGPAGWWRGTGEDVPAISLHDCHAVRVVVKDARIRIKAMRDLNARLAEFIRQNCDFNDLF